MSQPLSHYCVTFSKKQVVMLMTFCLALLGFTSKASTYDIDLQRGKVNLVPHLEYNVSSSLPSEAPPIEGWSSFQQDYVKLGFASNTHWFRTTLTNPTKFPVSLFIEVGNPLLDNLSFYTLKNGKVRNVQHLGDNQAFFQRPVQHETFVVPVAFLPGESLEIYFAIETNGTVNFPVTLWQKENFQQQQNYHRLLLGMFIGIMLATVFGYLLTGFVGKSKVALFDAALLFSLLMIVTTLSGLGFHYLWPASPKIQAHAALVLASIAIASSAFLAKAKIDAVKAKLPVSKSFFITGLSALGLIPLCLWLTYETSVYLVTSVAILICGCHIYSGLWMNRHGYNEDQDLNISVGILLGALVFIALNNFTSTPFPFSNLSLLQIAMLLMVSIFSVTSIRSQFNQAQRANNSPTSSGQLSKSDLNDTLEDFSQINESNADDYIEHIFEQTDVDDFDSEDEEQLRQKLAEQNLELQVTLRELEDRNTELEKLNTLDALSGINNRRHFDKRIQAELRRARREISPLSLIMFDIDHFKKVNDKYGHVAGDEVIRAVALTGSEQLSRSTDEIFRYGGEEFAVLLPSTELSGAEKVAENIRKQIESLEISTSHGVVKCTVSLGISCSKNETLTEPTALVELADKALYKAKQSGRNKTVLYSELTSDSEPTQES